MRFHRSPPFLLALSLVGILADRAAAQSSEPDQSAGSCFEIIAPQRHTHPASPLLFNKCTGGTWLLVRSHVEVADGRRGGRLVYRWVSLEVEGTPRSEASNRKGRVAATQKPAATETPNTGGGKCFVFTGRQFCE